MGIHETNIKGSRAQRAWYRVIPDIPAERGQPRLALDARHRILTKVPGKDAG